MYPEERVERFIGKNFIPVKVHVKEQPATFERFGAQWTPTFIILDADGVERDRFEGFLPADDFLAQLELGLAHVAFAGKRFADAQQRFQDIVKRYPQSEAAPAAQYWAGVAKYKATNDATALAETAQAFAARYSDSSWAKKASVWGGRRADAHAGTRSRDGS